MTDTSPQIAELVHSRLMEFSGAERLAMGSRMFDAARRMVLASFPKDLPEADIRQRLYERIYGEPHAVSMERFGENKG